MLTGVFDRLDRRAEPQVNAVFLDLMSEVLNEALVDEIKEAVARLNQRDAHIKR